MAWFYSRQKATKLANPEAVNPEAADGPSERLQQVNPEAADGPSERLQQVSLPPAAPLIRSPIRKLFDSRVPIPLLQLQSAIGEAVKTAAPGCEAFVGVVVRPKRPGSRLDANWELAGAKYGKADKKTANETLMPIVAQMQKDFLITEK